MRRRFRRGGLRSRLTVAISLVVLAALAGSFAALHQRIGSDLEGQIDSALSAQAAGFERTALPGVKTAADLRQKARRFVASQGYSPDSRIFAIEVAGEQVTNEREVLEREEEREREREDERESDRDDESSSGRGSDGGQGTGGSDGAPVPQAAPEDPSGQTERERDGEDERRDQSGGESEAEREGERESDEKPESEDERGSLLPGYASVSPLRVAARASAEISNDPGNGVTIVSAPEGFSTVETDEAGSLRVLSRPIVVEGSRLGTFRVADPRASVIRAQESLRNTFAVVGIVALALSALAAAWIASLIARPLRRMAGVASAVDGGDLAPRIGDVGRDYEVRVLAESFDRMLDRLAAAFRRQRDFVSDASHELRTPLTVVRGQVELLPRTAPGSAERDRIVETVLREIDRMNRLVDDMLMLAKAEGGRLVHKHPFELNGFLHDLERDLPLLGDRAYRVEGPGAAGAGAEDRGVEGRSAQDPAAQDPAAEGWAGGVLNADPDRVAQVLRNLAANAVRHTAPGGLVAVSATPRGNRIEFAVSDSGPGIPPDELERVFDRFHRTDDGRARAGGGTGLGLAIARAIVEAHGGRIWAESPPAGGARIRFELPGYRQA